VTFSYKQSDISLRMNPPGGIDGPVVGVGKHAAATAPREPPGASCGIPWPGLDTRICDAIIVGFILAGLCAYQSRLGRSLEGSEAWGPWSIVIHGKIRTA